MAEHQSLLPCPFCGGAADMDSAWLDKYNIDARFTVYCQECGASSDDAHDETIASEAWNIRVLSASPPSPSAPVAYRHRLMNVDGHVSQWILSAEPATGIWPNGRAIEGFEQEPLYAAPPVLAEITEALRFYADDKNWNDGGFREAEPHHGMGSIELVMSSITNDNGKVARAALSTSPAHLDQHGQGGK
jgi:Lar family restriction alleviation protein